LLCLASWFAFNLWILRDYFFPWWFSPIYTEKGLSKQKLELKKREILMRSRVSVAFHLPAVIGAVQQDVDVEDDEALKMLALIDARTASFSVGTTDSRRKREGSV